MRSSGLICLALAILVAQVTAPSFAGPSLVADVRTGIVLSHDDAFQRWQPASLTKLMTAYIAFRAVRAGKLSLTSPVRITNNALREPPSKMGYPAGSVLTLDNALKILIVKSANDVAVAIGEAVAGSELEFIEMMNAEAKRLGMPDTQFANPNGLPSSDQYTTAHDMAVLSVAIRREFPEYDPLFSIEAIKAGKKTMTSHNVLLGRFAGADGMKTGFVCASGFNIVVSAKQNGRQLVTVVLGALSARDRAERAADLLAAGFATSEEGLPTLATLRPYGEDRTTPANIRAQICTKTSSRNRHDVRDADGRMVFRSPHIQPMTREPVIVAVGLGGADGPPAANTVRLEAPIPLPWPADAPRPRIVALEEIMPLADTAAVAVGTPAPGIPVPTPRPSL